MVTPRGIEPLLPPWKGGVLTAWPRGHNMELAIGIEPTTCWLQVSCSTVEPCQHIITKKLLYFHFKFKWRLRRGSNPRPLAWQASTLTNWATEPHYGGNNRDRTCDPLLVRQMLSQLSYASKFKMVTPRGIEPLLPPWKGGVLTAWPRGLGFSFLCPSGLFPRAH